MQNAKCIIHNFELCTLHSAFKKGGKVMKEQKDIQEIKITYKDGSEKLVTRGVCFSVRKENETIFVECDGLAGTEADEIAVLTIVSRIAKELGIDEELVNKSEEVKKDNEQ